MNFRGLWIFLIVVLVSVSVPAVSVGAGEKPSPEVQILITTGGHGFDAEGFYGMFRAMPGIRFETIELPKQAAVLRPDLRERIDCLVLYDMVGELPSGARENFIALLRKGIGVVSLHHNLGANRDWDEYRKIIGGKFIFEACEIDGESYKPTPWAHGQRLKVQVVDKQHPITEGIDDFEIDDETYGRFYTAPGIHVLLRTDHPQNNPIVAWTTQYGASRVVYIQFGHDRGAYDNPNYRRLVHRAILWASGKLNP
jgi:type 1 glutamine amidotransferase